MDASTEKNQLNLTRQRLEGKIDRRTALKRGFKLGLSLPALAGLLAITSQQKAEARSGCYEILSIDYACDAACKATRDRCVARGGRDCASNYSSCRSTCYYHECEAEEGQAV
jgi:hypothetical protein